MIVVSSSPSSPSFFHLFSAFTLLTGGAGRGAGEQREGELWRRSSWSTIWYASFVTSVSSLPFSSSGKNLVCVCVVCFLLCVSCSCLLACCRKRNCFIMARTLSKGVALSHIIFDFVHLNKSEVFRLLIISRKVTNFRIITLHFDMNSSSEGFWNTVFQF